MSILRGLSWGYIERWGNKIISLLVFILLARLLDPKDFGLIAFAKLFIDYLDSFSGQGLDMAVIQRKEITDQHLNAAFWINVLIASTLALLLYALAPFIESYFAENGVAKVLQVLTIMFLINSLSRVQVAIMLRNYQFKQLAIRGLAMSICGGAVGVVLALKGYGVWSLVYQQISSMVVALLLLWRAAAWRPSLSFSTKAARELYAFAVKVFVDQQVAFASKRIDEALIAVFLGMTLLGYYSVAKRLFETAVDLIYVVLSKVLVSVFSKTQDDIASIVEKTGRVNTLMAAFSFPIFALASVANQEIVVFLFSEKWKLASIPFAILMLSGLFMLAPNLLHPVFNAIGKPVVPLKLNGARAIVSIILIWIGAPFGLLGIALAVFARNMVGAWLDFVYLKIELNHDVSSIWRDQLRYAFYCLPMMFAIATIGNLGVDTLNLTNRLFLYGIVGLFVYALTLLVFNAKAIDDSKIIWRKLSSKR